MVGDRGLGPGQLSREPEGGAEFPFRLRWPDHQQEEYAEVVVGVRHLAAEFGHGRVLPGQVASDRQGRAIFGLRLRWPAQLRQRGAEARVDLGQQAAESGEGGVVLG